MSGYIVNWAAFVLPIVGWRLGFETKKIQRLQKRQVCELRECLQGGAGGCGAVPWAGRVLQRVGAPPARSHRRHQLRLQGELALAAILSDRSVAQLHN